MTVGYSGTPLPRKLGIAPGSRLFFVDPPDDIDEFLRPLPDGVVVSPHNPDVVLAFVTTYADLAQQVPKLGRLVHPGGSLWIAWPKRASKVPTDITEESIRDVALPLGLVDNKVCAISQVWSGLRLVWRRERR